MQQLSTDTPTSELVAIYNKLNPKTPILIWKRKKIDLIERIEALPKPMNGTSVDIPRLKDDEYAVAIAAVDASDRDTIQVVSEKLLEAVAYEHDGRKWGIPYGQILAEVQSVFPDCKTTVACLRWYAAHLNQGGVVLPQRKRSKS